MLAGRKCIPVSAFPMLMKHTGAFECGVQKLFKKMALQKILVALGLGKDCAWVKGTSPEQICCVSEGMEKHWVLQVKSVSSHLCEKNVISCYVI